MNNKTGSGVSPRSTVEVNHGGTLGGHGAIGIGGSSAVVVSGPYSIEAMETYVAGAVAAGTYVAGAAEAETFVAGGNPEESF